MPTTRSATKQVRIDDFTDDNNTIQSNIEIKAKSKSPGTTKTKKDTKAVKSQKRKSPEITDSTRSSQDKTSQPNKKPRATRARKPTSPSKPSSDTQHQQTMSPNNITQFSTPIIINRSPVLQLWASTVAQFTHPTLSWQSCLSIGNAISALCAVSKGRAIGIPEPPKDETSDNTEKENNKNLKDTQTVKVMGFPLPMKNSIVLLNGTPKPLNEENLRRKFGQGNEYEQVQKAMQKGLEDWTENKEELDKNAFRMYEKFRPDVSQGQRGWGKKGELNLNDVVSFIRQK